MKLRMFYEEHGQKSTVWSGNNGFSPRKKTKNGLFYFDISTYVTP